MMKIILLLISCLPLFGATTYTVLTDNANRTFTGGATNMALLSGTNVFTGTNTFTAAKFFPANGIARRILWSSPTNFFFSSITNVPQPASNGGFYVQQSMLQTTLPPLLSSNSMVCVGYGNIRSNANASSAFVDIYVGDNTNWAHSITFASTGIGKSTVPGTAPILYNVKSFNSQVLLCNVAITNNVSPFAAVDTSVPWKIYVGICTTTSHTNLQVDSFWFEEIVIP